METRQCQNCKKDFIIEPDDFSFYEKIKVPPPTFCPECRMIRRMAFRDYRVLYKRKFFDDTFIKYVNMKKCRSTDDILISKYLKSKKFYLYYSSLFINLINKK